MNSQRASLLKQVKLVFFFLLPCISLAQWTQVGVDLDGSAAGDAFGRSVSLNATGHVLAVGTDRDSSSLSAYTRIFEWDGSSWEQKGFDIEGVEPLDLSGEYIQLNDSGNIVAIRARGVNNFAGAARMFQWSGTDWVQLGDDIMGDSLDAGLCGDLSLSADGFTVAIGACSNSGNGTNAGNTRIFDWNGTSWGQRGLDIDGEAALDQSGSALSMSANGTRVAIGAKINDGNGTGRATGHVRVFEWDGIVWTQLGADLNGTEAFQFFGSHVSLNDAGNVIAIGATHTDSATSDGFVQVLEWDGTTWVQRGLTLVGETSGEEYASVVDLDATGNVLAIGAYGNSDNGMWAGHVRIFSWDGTSWTQVGPDIDGEAAQDFSGAAVSLSADGRIVAIGAAGNDDNGTAAGQTRIFRDLTPIASNETFLFAGTVYPNPTNGLIHLSMSERMESLHLYSVFGKELLSWKDRATDTDLDLSLLPTGQYFLTIRTKRGLYTEKIIKF